ncbi:unnamed protein product [Allacma fusca]|uniref:Integrase zinc-binding domain-containing protein n=1 Tax=Allacma fusca TaxID=39272 RepID=A0A8J2NWN3_9HEXA|nr:unnamed protein product [Allacma fusca]
MQSIWGIQLGWDEILPDSFMQQSTTYLQQLPSLEGLEIRRYVMQHNYITAELHGFSDASEQAYAAAVYVRTTSVEGVKCNLIAAKSKVAPLEKISLPRLELCGAILLAKLMVKVERALKRKFDAKICWTDSTIVRDWIHAAPQRWQTFIAIRVTKIQNHFDPNQWHHISGKINPADVASRGITAEILVRDKLWWHVPSFLLLEDYSAELSVPPTAVIIEAVHEARKIPVHHVKVNAAFMERYSSLKKLEKHTAVWKRFMEYLKLKRYNNLNMLKVTIDTEELQQALLLWVNTAQRLEYSAEIKALEVQEHVSAKSNILALNPFLDAKGLLRVGGRLCNAQLPFDRKHPLLLPAKGHLTTLIVRHIHQQQFHAGLQLTLYTVQQRFWIPRGKEFVQGEIRKCTRCFRFSQNQQNQLMGDLPAARLVPSIPFNKTGVDYGGPFTLGPMKIRSNKTYKATKKIYCSSWEAKSHFQ